MTDADYYETYFSLPLQETKLTRFVDKAPFVPSDEASLRRRCEEILDIQSMGLKKRLAHTGAKTAVIGISGGPWHFWLPCVLLICWDWIARA